jgi:hypothetical protein
LETVRADAQAPAINVPGADFASNDGRMKRLRRGRNAFYQLPKGPGLRL